MYRGYELDELDDETSESDEEFTPYPRLGMSLQELDTQIKLLDASLVSNEEKQVELRAGVWDSLPEEILWSILMRLPMVTQCRLRCVCPKWKRLLMTPFSAGQLMSQPVSRPSCTIICNFEESEDRVYCHEENRWFRFPKPIWCKELQWILVATDGGLLCYESSTKGSLWLLVHNPFSGSFRALQPDFPRHEISFKSFSVDVKSKTFKVVLIKVARDDSLATVTFNSRTQEWKVFQSNEEDSLVAGEDGFFWKNSFYQRAISSPGYLVFNFESGLWSTIRLDLPCNGKDWYHIGSKKNQVLLVQVDSTADEQIQIWKLDNTADCLDLSTTRWEKVPVDIPLAMKPLVVGFIACKTHGHDYVVFTMGSPNHWIKYSLGARTWRVMPSAGEPNSGSNFINNDWFNWEPLLGMDVDPGDFKEKEPVMAAAALKMESDESDHHGSSDDDGDESDDGTDSDLSEWFEDFEYPDEDSSYDF